MAYIGDIQYIEDDNQFSLVVGLLTGGLVISVFIGITAVLILRRNKKRAITKCKMEMSKGKKYYLIVLNKMWKSTYAIKK